MPITIIAVRTYMVTVEDETELVRLANEDRDRPFTADPITDLDEAMTSLSYQIDGGDYSDIASAGSCSVLEIMRHP